MSPGARVTLLAAAAAGAAAAVTVSVVSLTASRPQHAQMRAGAPPLALDLGVSASAEARALRRAETLYAAGRRAQAGAIFRRYPSLPAQIGLAFSGWPGSLRRIAALAAGHPGDAEAQLNAGLALLWSGRIADAAAAWRVALRSQPDTLSAIRAEDLLYPRFPPGRPTFVPSFPVPAFVSRLAPANQLVLLAHEATASNNPRWKLLDGVALQRIGKSISAEREFAAAARLAPHDPEAQVAAAVGRFTKADPSRTFSRLGPLARRYPHSQSVRFHLGLCLLWLGQVRTARRELARVPAENPKSLLAMEAKRFLNRLAGIGTR